MATTKSTEKTATKNVPATTEPKAPAKINAKTKFVKGSPENEMVKDIKSRERKIDKAQRSLVGLWIAQGKELLEFIAVTEVSMRLAAELTGVKRTMVNTYCTIASDPRMLNDEFQDQLEQFSQKDLIKLTKLDDEEAFDKALETGEMPASETKMHITDVEAEPIAQPQWKIDMEAIINGAYDFYDAKKAMIEYFMLDDEDDIEAIIEESGEVSYEESGEVSYEERLLADALAKVESEDVAGQATEMGLKKSVLKTAIKDGIMSATTVEKINAFLEA